MKHVTVPVTQAVLFDLDGTLIDTAPTFVKVLNTLLANHGRPALPYDLIRKQVSNGARALITLAFGLQEGEAGFEPLRNELLDLYEDNISDGSRLFPGMNKVLQILEQKKIPWGIVTNKPIRFTLPLLNALSLDESCSVVICPDDVQHTKPHPEPLELACFRLDVNPQHCIYVGDHERDILAGNAANMKTITALFGYISEIDHAEKWNAHHCVNTPEEILNFINS